MSIEENKALVRREYEEGVNKGNLAVLDEIFAPDYAGHLGGLPEPIRGREAFKRFITTWRTAFPDLYTTIEDMIAEGDRVVVRHTWRGTQKGEFSGISPTGRQVIFTGIDIYRIAGGKIVEEWDNNDDLGMLQQLGAVPPIG